MKKCVCVCSFVGLGQQRSILVGSRMGYVMNECVEVMGIGLCCEYMAYGGTSTTGADERTSFLKQGMNIVYLVQDVGLSPSYF